jgi:nucleoside-diphosphate-sugar epimerase
MNKTDLTGQVAVVTGASRGIGQAIAIRLGRLGASVVVNYSRDSSGATETVAAIEAAGSRATGIRADVTKPAEIEALFAAARTQFGGLDIVVANAGLDEGLGPVLDVTETDYDRLFNVNAKGAFFTMQQAARMVSGGGSIVYIGSGSTLRPVTGFGLYASSKLPASYRCRPAIWSECSPRKSANEGSRSTRSSRARRKVRATSPSATTTARSARACRTPARSARGWARSTTWRTQSSSSPESSPAGSAGSSCSSVAARRADIAARINSQRA